jgi:hypothetical protein
MWTLEVTFVSARYLHGFRRNERRLAFIYYTILIHLLSVMFCGARFEDVSLWTAEFHKMINGICVTVAPHSAERESVFPWLLTF